MYNLCAFQYVQFLDEWSKMWFLDHTKLQKDINMNDIFNAMYWMFTSYQWMPIIRSLSTNTYHIVLVLNENGVKWLLIDSLIGVQCTLRMFNSVAYWTVVRQLVVLDNISLQSTEFIVWSAYNNDQYTDKFDTHIHQDHNITCP